MNRLPLPAASLAFLLAACAKETGRDAPVTAASAPPPTATTTTTTPTSAPPPTATAPTTPRAASPDAGAPGSPEACNAKCTADGLCKTLAACSDCLSMCMAMGGSPVQGTLSRTPLPPAELSTGSRPAPAPKPATKK